MKLTEGWGEPKNDSKGEDDGFKYSNGILNECLFRKNACFAGYYWAEKYCSLYGGVHYIGVCCIGLPLYFET